MNQNWIDKKKKKRKYYIQFRNITIIEEINVFRIGQFLNNISFIQYFIREKGKKSF